MLLSSCFSYEDINHIGVGPSLIVGTHVNFVTSVLYFQIKLHSRNQVLELQVTFWGKNNLNHNRQLSRHNNKDGYYEDIQYSNNIM